AGVELPVRIPDRLELPERLDELVAVHPRQQLRQRLAVAVLAGQRSTERRDEVRRLLEERAEAARAVRGSGLEVDSRVNATLPEVAVQGRRVAVLPQEGVEPAQVIGEPLGRHRPVLPACEAVAAARWKR